MSDAPPDSPHLPVVTRAGPVLLLGGGWCPVEEVRALAQRCAALVAADGGSDRALAAGLVPDAVIGDMDSLSPEARSRIPADRQHPVAEQDSTDFQKCLQRLRAPLILGLGFLGKRLDHELAAMWALAQHADTDCILIGKADIVLALPPYLALSVPPGSRVSLFPMARCTGRSTGLAWPIDGLTMAPDARIGTSNRADAARIELWMDAPGMLLILPRAALDQAQQAMLRPGARWPVRAAG